MSKIDIIDLLNHDLTNLPIQQSEKNNFKDLITEILLKFKEQLKIVSDNSLKITDHSLDITKYKLNIEKLCDGLIETISIYYKGDPAGAFLKLNEVLTNSDIRGFLDKDLHINPKTNFYRIRISKGNYPLNKGELFHIPFEKRGKVKTQRFSIPGLPSLYISNSIYVAWEEMRRPSFDSIQAVRLQNNKQLVLLDLTTDVYNNKVFNDNNAWDLLYKIIIWPLVACCSVKVKNHEDSFKPEYIIPQLLLQWINKEKLDGIKYSSTHIDLKNNNIEGSFYNIVLPVKTFLEQGFCRELKSLFDTTQVLPMQLRQFASFSDRFPNQASITSEVNPDIYSIELIKNVILPYWTTQFGILEYSLNSLEMGSFQNDFDLNELQIEILKLIVDGHDQTKIAKEICVKISIIEKNLIMMKQKFKSKNTLELIKFAIKNNIISV